MNIKTITLQERGLKGLEISYTEPDKASGKVLNSDIKKKRRHPIHLGLEIPFKDLRYHLVEIFGYIKDGMTKNDIDALVEQCDVTGVEMNPEYFVIKGKMGCFMDKELELKTPKVEMEDDYEHFETVVNILKKIIEETKLYMAGDVKVDDTETVIKWIGAGKEKGMDINSFNSLTEEEQRQFCQKILEENFGAVVLMQDDVSIGEVVSEEISESIELNADKETIILKA